MEGEETEVEMACAGPQMWSGAGVWGAGRSGPERQVKSPVNYCSCWF